MNTLIIGRRLEKTYRLKAEEIHAVNKVDIDILMGDFVAIMGPSGSGKTTLLDILGCMDALTDGELHVLGEDVSDSREQQLVKIRRKYIGFVFQEFLLIQTLTALENVLLPLTFAHKNVPVSRAEELLHKVDLGHRLHHLPKHLSGGEKQRVAIARALVTDPKILIADEPTGNLDSANSQHILNIFNALNKEGLTIIMATHDRTIGEQVDRIIQLKDGMIV
jgi:putative ABC transport system ATP-binding protein